MAVARHNRLCWSIYRQHTWCNWCSLLSSIFLLIFFLLFLVYYRLAPFQIINCNIWVEFGSELSDLFPVLMVFFNHRPLWPIKEFDSIPNRLAHWYNMILLNIKRISNGMFNSDKAFDEDIIVDGNAQSRYNE